MEDSKKTNLKLIIREELDDFDWVKDVKIDYDLTPSQFYHRYEGNLPLKFVDH